MLMSSKCIPGLLWSVLLPGALLASVLTGPAASASPSSEPDVTDDVNGIVFASVQVGDRTFVGGEFTTAGGQPHLNAAAIAADGTVDPTWAPELNDRVYSLAASQDGSMIYLGGEFTTVNGASRARLVAVDAVTGDLVRGWRANAPAEVSALAVSGDRLYAGGLFRRIDGAAAPRLAALTASTGEVDNTFAPRPDGKVNSLVVSPDGQRLYAGGRFTTVAGVSRPGIAELDPTSGAATSFAPEGGGTVRAVALTPDGSRLFFSTLSNLTWAYDPAQSNTPRYTVKTGGDVQAIAVSATEVYVGGHFGQIIGQPHLDRPRLASFQVSDGTPTDFRVELDSFFGVWTLTVTPQYLVVGGAFENVNGQPQQGFARFSGTV